MHDEETWIKGALYSRSSPDASWRIVLDPEKIATAAMKRLSDDQRMKIIRAYCQGCGTPNLSCQCWNDE